MEAILGQSVQGLGRMLSLRGSVSGPPGVELGIPSPTFFDLTQLGRYGSALQVDPRSDGWWLLAFQVSGTGVGFYLIDFNIGDTATSPRKIDTDIFWVYRIGVEAVVSASLGDLGGFSLFQQFTAPSQFGPAGLMKLPVWTGNGGNVSKTSVLAGVVRSIGTPWAHGPMPFPPAVDVNGTLEVVGAGTVTLNVTMLGRFVPAGVPPLP